MPLLQQVRFSLLVGTTVATQQVSVLGSSTVAVRFTGRSPAASRPRGSAPTVLQLVTLLALLGLVTGITRSRDAASRRINFFKKNPMKQNKLNQSNL